MNSTKRIARYTSRRYTMTGQESALWHAGDESERRRLLGALTDRLADTVTEEGECHYLFHLADGTLVARGVVHPAMHLSGLNM